MKNATIYVVDDDLSVRKGLTRLLRSTGYKVEAFGSADAFLMHERYEDVACLLLDLCMSGMNGIELQQRLEHLDDTMPIIFLSGHAGVPDSVQAMKRGAVDFLTKPIDEEVLLPAIEVALERCKNQLAKAVEMNSIKQRIETLTQRELETAQWVISGLLNKQIATQLGIAEKTVKAHRAKVMQKMGVSSVVELVRLCSIAGIDPMSAQE